MPVGMMKNAMYTIALPILGRRSSWKNLEGDGASGEKAKALEKVLEKNHVMGAAIQRIFEGKLAECYFAGQTGQGDDYFPIRENTFFRTASIAKMVTALLVFRLQTLGLLRVEEDISEFWGKPVRNPAFPNEAITLSMLLSHTSSLVDSPAYFASLSKITSLSSLLADPGAFSNDRPGTRFRYSNLAAGMVGCLLEVRFQASLERLAQEYLFEPLQVRGTFDLTTLPSQSVANSYRILPSERKPAFDVMARHRKATAIAQPEPEFHYMLASGNLFITAEGLAKLLLPLQGDQGFLDGHSIAQMKAPLGQWPETEVPICHGMGLLSIEDFRVSSRRVFGHQGFAYGAVNGCFFSEDGAGFVSLNSGASEARHGHLSLLNRDLIKLFMP